MRAAKPINEAAKIDPAELNPLINVLGFLESVSRMAASRSAFSSMILYLLFRISTNILDKPTPSSQRSSPINSWRSSTRPLLQEGRNMMDTNCLKKQLDPRFVYQESMLDRSSWEKARKLVYDEIEGQIPSASEVDLFLMNDQVTEDENFNWEPLNPTTASPTNRISNGKDLELVGYLADDRLPVPTPNKDNSCDVMNYWMKKANKFSNISRMARKFLITLTSSAKPERVFSELNHLLSNPKRANLKDETVERLTTIRHDIACRKLESFDRQPPEKKLEIEDEADTTDEGKHL